MKSKVSKRINGGLAIYYGVGLALTVVGSLVAVIIWIYRIIQGKDDFSWWTLIAAVIATTALGLAGYSILRVGYEELEQ